MSVSCTECLVIRAELSLDDGVLPLDAKMCGCDDALPLCRGQFHDQIVKPSRVVDTLLFTEKLFTETWFSVGMLCPAALLCDVVRVWSAFTQLICKGHD